MTPLPEKTGRGSKKIKGGSVYFEWLGGVGELGCWGGGQIVVLNLSTQPASNLVVKKLTTKIKIGNHLVTTMFHCISTANP